MTRLFFAGFVAVCCLCYWQTVPAANTLPGKAATIAGWIMVQGCPYPNHPHPYVVALTFSDGKIFSYTDDADEALKVKIRAALGDMAGRVYKFACGTSV